MDKDTEKWLVELVLKLNPQKIYVNTEDKIVGYFWNGKKKQLHFISQKEADKLTRKEIAWKHLGEDWFVNRDKDM